MHWITRERPKVGRVGCAWLIRRFIDPEAIFFFAPGAQVANEAERLQATIFHVDGSALSRQGNSSSFAVTCAHYNLTQEDPAMELLCAIVNTADIPRGPTQRPEGPGLRAAIDGLLLIVTDDHTIIEQGGRIFDALYAYCGEQVRRDAARRLPSTTD
jgi:hypothetical protein